jgi:peptidoglycan hydrolase CwlO-like protein
MKKYFASRFVFIIFLFLSFLVFGIVPHIIKAQSDAEKLQDLNKKIQEYQNKISELEQQSNTLANQIAQFDAQITLAQLKIDQITKQTDLLIGRIGLLENSLDSLTTAYTARLVESYKMSRVDSGVLLFLLSPNLDSAVKSLHYLRKLQEADQNLLHKLQSARDIYQKDKADLEDLNKKLQIQKNALDSQKNAKAQLLAITQSDEIRYQKLLSQAQAELSAFRKFVVGQGGASILSNQTVCDDWGCYYNQRDSQWGTRTLGNSNLSVAEYGCLVSASAMIATHYKKNLNPADIASNPNAFFSPNSDTALLWIDITVNGIRILRTSIGTQVSNIDSELSAGRPVIVGLYPGPAHFIVLKSGSNGNYIMNDPFMENGHDVSFASKYLLSDITDVEKVSVY